MNHLVLANAVCSDNTPQYRPPSVGLKKKTF